MHASEQLCGTLHRAIESRDVDKLLSLYADDAELRVVDRNHPPSHPLELRGKAAIAEHLRDVFGRDMTHEIVNEISGEGGIAYSEECRYPDGTRVFTNASLELEGGRIIREVEVQAWDESAG